MATLTSHCTLEQLEFSKSREGGSPKSYHLTELFHQKCRVVHVFVSYPQSKEYILFPFLLKFFSPSLLITPVYCYHTSAEILNLHWATLDSKTRTRKWRGTDLYPQNEHWLLVLLTELTGYSGKNCYDLQGLIDSDICYPAQSRWEASLPGLANPSSSRWHS